MKLDLEFNNLLESACRNEYATRSMQMMQGLSRRFWYRHYREAADLPLCANLHAEHSLMIAEQNLSKADAACNAVIDYLEGFTRAALDH